MEGVYVDDIDYSEHQQKCRICFKPFGAGEHRIEISKLVERRFKEITQMDVSKQV